MLQTLTRFSSALCLFVFLKKSPPMKKVANISGCDPTDSALVRCLRSKSEEDLRTLNDKVIQVGEALMSEPIPSLAGNQKGWAHKSTCKECNPSLPLLVRNVLIFLKPFFSS